MTTEYTPPKDSTHIAGDSKEQGVPTKRVIGLEEFKFDIQWGPR